MFHNNRVVGTCCWSTSPVEAAGHAPAKMQYNCSAYSAQTPPSYWQRLNYAFCCYFATSATHFSFSPLPLAKIHTFQNGCWNLHLPKSTLIVSGWRHGSRSLMAIIVHIRLLHLNNTVQPLPGYSVPQSGMPDQATNTLLQNSVCIESLFLSRSAEISLSIEIVLLMLVKRTTWASCCMSSQRLVVSHNIAQFCFFLTALFQRETSRIKRGKSSPQQLGSASIKLLKSCTAHGHALFIQTNVCV